MKKLIVSLLLTLVTATSFGASTTVRSVGTNSVVASPLTSSSFIFSNTNLIQNVTVAVFDTAGSDTSYTNGTYSAIVYTQTTITNAYTNYFGVINSNVYTALVQSTNTVAAATNFYTPVFVYIAPSNAISTVNFNYGFTRGVLVTNTPVLNGVTVNYTQ